MPPATERPATAETRVRLLRAAGEELEECGHAGISLRAVARRADLSHAAPKHHFHDRAGLLTATATLGFEDLAQALDEVEETDPVSQLDALGRAYVDFGLAHPALFDLMFRPSELKADDPQLLAAQAASTQALRSAAHAVAGSRGLPADMVALMAWSLVHGLVALAGDGVLGRPVGAPAATPATLAHELVTAFSDLLAP